MNSNCLRSRPGGRRRSKAVGIEALEGRTMLTGTPGVDYVDSGFAWSNPAHVTYSVAPDGVNWDHAANSLHAAFDARFGPGVWERELARALATWEAAANINIAQVADGPYNMNALGAPQGDPRFGDIRFGGYAFANTTTTLAQTYFPPPNGATEAGDVEVNTAMNFNVGSDYDLFSVMLHETGHALGLDHVLNPADVMDPTYGGVRQGLGPGDAAGIQSLYGPRTPDAFRSQGRGADFAGAVDVTASLDPAGYVVQRGVSLSTVGDTEYFSVVAPAGATGVMHAAAVAQGVSLLSPKVTVFDASGAVIASASDPTAWGNDAVASAPSVVPGRRYFVAVTGATGDAFAVGSYVLAVAFEGVRPPAVTAPAPVAPDRFEPNNTPTRATPLGSVSQTVVNGLTLDTAADVDDFVWQNARAGLFVAAAPAFGGQTHVRVFDASGHTLADGTGVLAFRLSRPNTRVFVEVSSATGRPVPAYGLVVAQVPTPAAPKSAQRGGARREVAVAEPAPASIPAWPRWAASWAKARHR